MNKFNIENILTSNLFYFVLFILILVIFLGPFYGIIPLTNVSSLGILFPALGSINCIVNMDLNLPCMCAGYPEGSVFFYGISFKYIVAILQKIADISTLYAYNIVGCLFLTLGWFGVFKIIRLFNGLRLFAFLGGLLFLFMPIVWAKSGYITLMWAFSLFPLFIYFDLIYFSSKKLLIKSILMIVSKAFLIFLDPYVFVMSSLFSIVLVSHRVLIVLKRQAKIKEVILQPIIVVFSLLIAFILYRIYVPGGAKFSVMPMDFFRGQGIDLIFFFYRKAEYFFINDLWNSEYINPRLFYTDGESVHHVYIGVGLLASIPMLFIFYKKLTTKFWLLLITALITFFISLGPSLKFDNRRSPEELTSKYISFEDYLMPEEAAIMKMPYNFVYKLPPFNNMRSVSRWILPTIFVLIVSLMVIMSIMWKRKTVYAKVIVLFLSIWVILEYTPSFTNKQKRNKELTKDYRLFNTTALKDFLYIVNKDEIVLFIQKGGLKNEYFSSYLCSHAMCRSYNVSGDKVLNIAVKTWPKKIYNLSLNPSTSKIKEVLRLGLADKVIIPFFDMRWDSYNWPPSQSTVDEYKVYAQSLSIGSDFHYEESKWFALIKQEKEN